MTMGMHTLSGGPSEVPAAEQVYVEVVHCLAGVGAAVDDGTVALQKTFVARDLRCGVKKVSNQRSLLVRCVIERGDVLTRNDEDVHGGLRIDVSERDALVVFIDRLGRNTAVHDFAEEATHDEFSVQEGVHGAGDLLQKQVEIEHDTRATEGIWLGILGLERNVLAGVAMNHSGSF